MQYIYYCLSLIFPNSPNFENDARFPFPEWTASLSLKFIRRRWKKTTTKKTKELQPVKTMPAQLTKLKKPPTIFRKIALERNQHVQKT